MPESNIGDASLAMGWSSPTIKTSFRGILGRQPGIIYREYTEIDQSEEGKNDSASAHHCGLR